jgi:hypothetical protein
MMSEERIVATVTIPRYKGGEDKDLEMLVRNPYDLDDCEKGKTVILIGNDQSQWTGTFVSVDDEDVIIESLESNDQIGFPIDGLVCFLEEITE